jgi:hypothetical protein
MEDIFTLELNNQYYDIRQLDLPPNGIHYGVCKEGILQFIVKRNLNIEGDTWSIEYPDKNLLTPQNLVDTIAEKIHAYFTA